MLAESKNICIIYHICLKVMITICPKARIAYHKGKTTLFPIDSHRSNIYVPKTLFWLEIVLLQCWKLKEIVPPRLSMRKT